MANAKTADRPKHFPKPAYIIVTLIAEAVDVGGHTTVYGPIQIEDRQSWQVAVFVAGFGVTFLPPWWWLQTALRTQRAPHRWGDKQGPLEQ